MCLYAKSTSSSQTDLFIYVGLSELAFSRHWCLDGELIDLVTCDRQSNAVEQQSNCSRILVVTTGVTPIGQGWTNARGLRGLGDPKPGPIFCIL